jgi:ABC-type lipoprotein export system ATPase subunit
MRVELARVGHAYVSGTWLFRGLDYTFIPGRSYALRGASGAGKSTLMAILAGWISPTEGEIVERDVVRKSWVFQSPHGTPRRTAVDHVAYPMIAAGRPPEDADADARGLLQRFALGHVAERQFRHLSGGEAQRLMLARATATEPDLLLVDEPTAQLDRATAQVVNGVIANVVSPSTIVVVATHDQGTWEACDVQIELESFRAAGER